MGIRYPLNIFLEQQFTHIHRFLARYGSPAKTLGETGNFFRVGQCPESLFKPIDDDAPHKFNFPFISLSLSSTDHARRKKD